MEIKGRQSSLGNISQMREIITPSGRLTRLREIPKFSIKLREAPAECGRVDSSASWRRVFLFKWRNWNKNSLIGILQIFASDPVVLKIYNLILKKKGERKKLAA